jgi:hypothetical protein
VGYYGAELLGVLLCVDGYYHLVAVVLLPEQLLDAGNASYSAAYCRTTHKTERLAAARNIVNDNIPTARCIGYADRPKQGGKEYNAE